MNKIIHAFFAVMCVAIGASSVSADALTGTKWNWTSAQTPAGSTTVLTPSNYTLDFKPAGKVFVKADCNTGNGTYKVKGKTITFGPIAMTRKMCPEGSMDTKFLQGLAAARLYKVIANVMTIDLVADGGTMAFVRAGSNPLPGSKWQWNGTQTPVEMITPQIPANYTLEFLVGTVNVKADCNTGSGKYTVKGSSITFGPIAMTRMMCQPGSLDTKFLQQLSAARTFRVEGDKMMMDLVADGGTMQYSAVGAQSANPLRGTKWNWVSTQTPTGTINVPSPMKYVLDFLTDDRVAVQADCNKGSGNYTVSGNNLTFGGIAMTMMACPPGSLGTKFGQQLGAARLYKITGDRLSIDLADGGGTMMFVRPTN